MASVIFILGWHILPWFSTSPYSMLLLAKPWLLHDVSVYSIWWQILIIAWWFSVHKQIILCTVTFCVLLTSYMIHDIWTRVLLIIHGRPSILNLGVTSGVQCTVSMFQLKVVCSVWTKALLFCIGSPAVLRLSEWKYEWSSLVLLSLA
jgi:hypothetical protein